MADEFLWMHGRVRRGDLDLRVDLELPRGVIALVGPNGTGKTSVLRVIAGLDPLAEGELSLEGTVLDRPADGVLVPPEDRDVSMVFQEPRLFPHLTVDRNLAYPLERQGMAADAALAAAADTAATVGLADFGTTKPRDLSGGQAQRVNIGRAMIARPNTVLMDEPLAAIDDRSKNGLRRLFRDSGAERVLWVTHDPADAAHADLVVSIVEGRLGQTAP